MAEINQGLAAHISAMKQNAADRDRRMREVYMVRTGRTNELFDGLFPGDFPKPIIANAIDVMAQDYAEQVGVLPTFSAAGDSIISETKRNHADRLTKIVNFYTYASNLGMNLIQGADRLNTYGFVPFRVEPNYDAQRPHIHIDDSMGAYFARDRWGRVTQYAKIFTLRASVLAAMFPEHADRITNKSPLGGGSGSDPMIDLCRWYDDDSQQMIILSTASNDLSGLVLQASSNPISTCPVAIAQRPTVDGDTRGAFDDVLWVYAAKARLALLMLEATTKAVEAPIALPQDVQEIAFGPDAILRSATPERIRRVGLDLPQAAVMEDRLLDTEMKFGARYPEVRAGQTDSSIVTGRGVQALQAGFDARVKTAQLMMGDASAQALSMCLEMDEAIWPEEKKTVSSVTNGTPYELKYSPKRDIGGDYKVNYEYGVMAGLDPNRALVWSLQGLGAGLFSKSFVRRNLPVDLDVLEEEKVIDVERLRDAALGSVEAYSQSLPQLAMQGQDPSKVIKVISSLIDQRKKGVPIEDAIAEAFQEDEKQPSGEMQPEGAMAPQPEEMMGAEGMAPGAPAGPMGGGPPPQTQSMQQLLAGLSGDGTPTMAARTMRQRAI